MAWGRAVSIVVGLGSLGACKAADGGGIPHDRLSQYGFFAGPLRALEPADGVVPYTVVAPLWADHADKARFLVLPADEAIEFSADELWRFPAGTILIKNFFFDLDRREPGGDARIVETRLLVLEQDGWRPHTYVWNEEETDADYEIVGDRIDVAFVDENGMAAKQEYLVPNRDQCNSCHARNDETHVLGLITHQLNFVTEIEGQTVNHLQWLADRGAFSGVLPGLSTLPKFEDPWGSASLEARARSYLHANCSHCHRSGAGAGVSGLDFTFWNQDPGALGICKEPAAAGKGTGGREFDIVPGSPDQSIVVFRMESSDPEIKMPEIPSRLPDWAGAQLVREWIAAMPPQGCGG